MPEHAPHHLKRLIVKWLNMPTFRHERRYLEAHQEILGDLGLRLLDELIASPEAHGLRVELAEHSRRALHKARADGADTAAIRLAYADLFTGLALDVPRWLGRVEQRLEVLRKPFPSKENVAACVALLRTAVARSSNDPAVAPETRAELAVELADALGDTHGIDRAAAIEEALAAYVMALQTYQRASHPYAWARVQDKLATSYRQRFLGDRATNVEDSLRHSEAALEVYTATDFPLDYARTASQLGMAFLGRMHGDRGENIEQAIRNLELALNVFDTEHYPLFHAPIRACLGIAYQQRTEGGYEQNQSCATAHFHSALEIYTADAHPMEYAYTQEHLGVLFTNRTDADGQFVYLEEAFAHFEDAARVLTIDTAPADFARLKDRIGTAYWRWHDMAESDEQAAIRLRTAISCYQEALTIYSAEAFPAEHGDTQLSLASLAFSELAVRAERDEDPAQIHRAYEMAHQAFAAARRIQAELGWLAWNPHGRVLLRGQSGASREMFARDAWCLWRLGDLRGAAVALEAGRAQALAESQMVVHAVSDGVCALHANAFDVARQQWMSASGSWEDAQAARAASEALNRARQMIRAHCRADFLPDEPTYDEIAHASAPDQLLIYLAATDRGGFALVIPPAAGGAAGDADALYEPVAIALPSLTWETIDDWLMRPDGARIIVGGFQFATQYRQGELLDRWVDFADDDKERERARRLATPLQDVPRAAMPEMPILGRALGTLVARWQAEVDRLGRGNALEQLHAACIRRWLREPVSAWRDDGARRRVLVHGLGPWLMREELDHVLDELRRVFMETLRDALDALLFGSADQRIALIPTGQLSVLPLHAVPVRGGVVPFGETCILSYQASARALSTSHRKAASLPVDGPVVALGDPYPTGCPPLPYARLEAQAIARAARAARRAHSYAFTRQKATLQQFRQELRDIRDHQSGSWIQVASHGSADPSDSHQCFMVLAHDEKLTLADLERGQLLDGVRGIVASGCMTAIADVETAPDEMTSFVAGLLFGGAACAIATQWPVSDRATCILMIQFYRLLLAGPNVLPERALRDAMHWLRTATDRQLLLAQERIGQMRHTGADQRWGDATRGVIGVDEADGGDAQERAGAHFAPTQLLRRAAQLLSDGATPFGHPIYWASAVIYGA